MEEEDNYVIFWEKLANSGVIRTCKAKNPEEAVEKCGFNTKIVKHTVVKGEIALVIGKED